MSDDHTPPGRAMDFNDGTRRVWFDETHAFAAAQDRLRTRFGDEWEDMHRQACTIARISPLSYSEAVDRILRREDIPVVPTVRFPQADLSPFYRQMQKAVRELMEVFTSASTDWARQLRDAGLLPEEPPDDPRERALWARKNRNTGPARPTGQAARRPRRHQ